MGDNVLVRADLLQSSKIIRNRISSSLLKTTGIRSLQQVGMFILLTTLDGDVYVLHAESLFPLSTLHGYHIQQAMLLGTCAMNDHPYLLLLQEPMPSSSSSSSSSSQSLLTATLTFGTLTISTEVEAVAPSLFSYTALSSSSLSSSSLITLLSVLPNPSSFTLHLHTLSVASSRQQFISLLRARRYEDAFRMAEKEGFDTTAIYRRKLQELLSQWKSGERRNQEREVTSTSSTTSSSSTTTTTTIDQGQGQGQVNDQRRMKNQIEREEMNKMDENWLEAPSADCGEIITLLENADPMLIFYVLSSDFIPSAATCETLLRYASHRLHCLQNQSSSTSSSTSQQDRDNLQQQLVHQLHEYLYRWELFRSGARLTRFCSIQAWQLVRRTPLVDLQKHLILRGDISTLKSLWQFYGGEVSEQAEAMRNGAIEAFTIGVTRQQQQGHAISLDLIDWMETSVISSRVGQSPGSHHLQHGEMEIGSDTMEWEEVKILGKWICSFVEEQLQVMNDDLPREKHVVGMLLRNLLLLTEMMERHPFGTQYTEEQALTERILKLADYLRELSELIVHYHLSLLPSPSAELPSNEELVIQLLDSLSNPSLFQVEFAHRVKPFCHHHNLRVEEVLSYYLKTELEKVEDLDMRRVKVVWDEIGDGDLCVEALRGLVLRPPPYPEELCVMIEECSQRVGIMVMMMMMMILMMLTIIILMIML